VSGPDFVVRGRKVLAAGRVEPRTVHVAAGTIAAVGGYHDVPPGCPVVDAEDAVVMPGLVDTHVHVNEPGRTEWEGFATATRAAAAGGVTTLIDMPLNSVPPTTSAAALASKLAAARDQVWIDVGFWGGVVPGNTADLAALSADGVLGFKCFLVDSGVAEFAHVDADQLERALRVLAVLDRPLLVHAETPGPIAAAAAAQRGLADALWRQYRTFLASRPPAAEDEAVAVVVAAARRTGAAVHVVHHCSATSLADLARARNDGLRITAETCPHYLHFAAEDIADGATAFKCAPPIREADNRERLWQGLADGVLDMVVSDHSPCTPALKGRGGGSFRDAWGGIASLQLGLAVMWTEAHRRGIGLPALARWMAQAPAELAGLAHRKGALAPGYDADIVVWDPDRTFEVGAGGLQHRHHLTPYAGETLRGVVCQTYVRGQLVYDDGEFAAAPVGALLVG
jgi:allantoinase